MKLNLYIIQDGLPHLHLKGAAGSSHSHLYINHPVLCTEFPTHWEHDILYIFSASLLPKRKNVPSHITIMVAGMPTDEWIKNTEKMLYTQEVTDPGKLMNEVTALFFSLQNWENTLQKSVDEGQLLIKLAELSKHIFRNPILVQGNEFSSVFHYVPKEKELPEFSDIAKKYIAAPLTNQQIQLILKDPEYIRATTQKTPDLLSAKLFGFRSLCFNLYTDGILLARLFIDEAFSPIKPSYYGLIQILGAYIVKGINRNTRNQLNTPTQYNNLMEKMLKNKSVSLKTVTKTLNLLGWAENEHYICAIFRGTDHGCFDNTCRSFAMYLSRVIQPSCFYLDKLSVVFIFNLSRYQLSHQRLLEDICAALNDTDYTASFSKPFNNFSHLYHYYHQAKIIDILSTVKKSERKVNQYDDVAMDYLLKQYVNDTIVEAIIPERLSVLLEYDHRKGTSYVSVLKTYLECERSPSKTARKSFLHINTLSYQIQRIQNIMNTDLNDPHERFLLQAALYLLEK